MSQQSDSEAELTPQPHTTDGAEFPAPQLGPQHGPQSPHPTSRSRTQRIMTDDLSERPRSPPLPSNTFFSPASEGGSLSPGTDDRVFPIRSVVSMDPTPTPSNRERLEGYFSTSARAREARRYSITSGSTKSSESRTSSRPRQESSQMAAAGTHELSTKRGSTGDKLDRRLPQQIFNDIVSSKSGSDMGTLQSSDRHSSPAQSVSGHSIRSAAESQGDTPLMTARFKHVISDGGHAIITGRDGETLQRCEDEPIHIPGAIQGFGLLIALEEESDGKLIVRIVSENSRRLMGYSPKQLFALENFCDILSEEQTDNLLDHIDFIRDEEADVAINGPEVFTLTIRGPEKKARKFWCAMHVNPANPNLVICEFELEDDPMNPLVPSSELTPELPEDTLQSNPTAEEFAESTQNISRPLRVLRSARKRKGEAAAMEVFNIMSQVQEQLAAAPNLDNFLKVLVGVVKELTGFHRVMIYQFDAAWNGRVVTELVDPRATKDLYKGLNFPASDIPKQARDLYRVNRVRLLYDRDQETARLVCRTIEDLETPLDLTYAYLRAMSPIHLKYLENMAVRSSMSISINAFDELWGLIACHSYGPRGMRVSFPIRKMCRLVGDSASRNIERLSYASRLQARKLINTVPTQHNPSGYIIASSEDLLKLFDADFGLLSIRDETKILGELEQSQEALAMLEYLRMRKVSSVTTSQDVSTDFPDLRYPPGFQHVAGMLVVPLSASGTDFIVFFRRGQLKEVKWAGNPRLLLANSAHEVRTPLNAIINYLEIALEGTLDHETRENLAKSHSASKSLIYVINDLLDLTKTEEGGPLIKGEVFDLRATFKEATDLFVGDAKRKGISYEVNERPGVPQRVIGDQRRVRQAISNVTANAIQNTTQGGVKVDIYVLNWDKNHVNLEISVLDTGVGMSSRKLDALFRDLEQVQSETTEMLEESLAPNSKRIEDGGGEKRTLGLGLAVVSRVVRNMNGQLRLRSEEGKGSRFIIQLPFDLPDDDDDQKSLMDASASTPQNEGPAGTEVTLVEKGDPHVREGGLIRRDSADSVNSKKSRKSLNSLSSANSGRSDVDRLIEAIQEPHMVETRPNSGGERTRSGPSTTRPFLEKRSTHTGSAPSSPGNRQSDKEVHRRSQPQLLPVTKPGQAEVPYSGFPIKPVKVADEESPVPEKDTSSVKSGIIGEVDENRPTIEGPLTADHMRVLVAEDDPVNSKIVKKRLEKLGHDIVLTVNGEECASIHGEHPESFDVVLMDMQMPIVDGLTSTKMIRSFEKTHMGHSLSRRASLNGRIPIIAVSASLEENKRQCYMDAGFDAWILKPISFPRLQELMTGIVDPKVRQDALYTPGDWERGGWFEAAQPDLFQTRTKPSERIPTKDASEELREAARSDDPDAGDSSDQQAEEQARLREAQSKELRPSELRLSKSTPDLGRTSKNDSDDGSGSSRTVTDE